VSDNIKIEERTCSAYKCKNKFKIYYLEKIRQDWKKDETGEIVKNVEQFVFAGDKCGPVNIQNLNLCPACCKLQELECWSTKSKKLAMEAGFQVQ